MEIVKLSELSPSFARITATCGSGRAISRERTIFQAWERPRGVIDPLLKIRSYLPGKTSAGRHASTLLLPARNGSFENKGTVGFTPVPENTAKTAVLRLPHEYARFQRGNVRFPRLSRPSAGSVLFSAKFKQFVSRNIWNKISWRRGWVLTQH